MNSFGRPLIKIYKPYILPILEYACVLWDDCCIRDTQTLECLQLWEARLFILFTNSLQLIIFKVKHT